MGAHRLIAAVLVTGHSFCERAAKTFVGCSSKKVNLKAQK